MSSENEVSMQQPAMNEAESRRPRLAVASGGAPIYGAPGPNNAEPVSDVDYAELGSYLPLPHQSHTKRPRLLLGTSAFTRYLKSLGAKKNAAVSGEQPVYSYHHGQGIQTKGVLVQTIQGKSGASLSARPFHIRLEIDNSDHPVATYNNNPRTSSPDEYRRSRSSSTRQILNRVPEEDMETSPSDTDLQEGNGVQVRNNGDTGLHRYYGSVGQGAAPPGTLGDGSRPDGDDEENSELSEEEEEWLLDEELAKEGLYRGSYKNLVALYTLVPLSTLFAFVFLALLPNIAFRSSTPSLFPYPPYFSFPIPELLVSMSLWALSYLLRDFLCATSLTGANLVPASSHRFPTIIPILTSIFSSFLQSASSLFFRQLAIPILLIPYYSTEHLERLHKRHFPTWHDDAFRRVWWVALGWAAAEAVVGIKQGYESIALYKDVLVTAKKNSAVSNMESAALRSDVAVTPTRSPAQVEEDSSVTPTQRDRQNPSAPRAIKRTHSDSLSSVASDSHSHYGDHRLVDVVYGEQEPLLKVHDHAQFLTHQPTNGASRLSVEDEVERDLDQLLACKSREELEEVYGIPVIRIPVFISCLHRINSILSSLGICMLLTAAYMRSTFAYTHPSTADSLVDLPTADQYPASNRPLAYTIPPVLFVQALMSMMHTPWVLPRIGIHSFVYINSMISLGLFFGGLGVWEVLT
ncbi:hypothetical protein JR316_0011000 [Psilocybe cubensis]|uniref:Uncharacterized protein n=2 Tax=Psilocybe cubensis TaxID=181762 RepID=A0ACB8GND9_PSICU|nr:hypothetical protein JR316_0011000 [Psilocybe cubensis]KAH9477084.1 hypothetical protein JR316_0011000 [Psilocybe cubensis]